MANKMYCAIHKIQYRHVRAAHIRNILHKSSCMNLQLYRVQPTLASCEYCCPASQDSLLACEGVLSAIFKALVPGGHLLLAERT
eukprot:SAG11_NODE_18537_length_488_cov_0.922879_1_plen_83_part_10